MHFDVASAVLWIFPLLLAVVLHEWAHGYAAYRLGDPTAADEGRLTLNPIAHIDPVGTIAMPALLLMSGAPFLFGYAKPVPIGWHNLRNPARDMVYVAAAGPAMNLALAVLSALVLAGLAGFPQSGAGYAPVVSEPGGVAIAQPLIQIAGRSVIINVVLAVFNLMPIPPLDGGRVAVGLLPEGLASPLARLEPFGMAIIFLLLMTGVLGALIGPLIGLILGVLLSIA